MAEPDKRVDDQSFKGGVMSPNSKQTFSGLRKMSQVILKHQLIFDEEIFEQKFLRCLICRERFDLESRTPRILPCHHTYCAECIDMFFQKESEYRQCLSPTGSSDMPYAVSITCATCRANFFTTYEGLKQLTMDHRVIQLLDFIHGNTDKQAASYCQTHTSKPLNFFCEECVQPVCRDCTVLDHKICASKDLVRDMLGALQKYTSLIDKGIQDMEAEAKLIDEKRELLTSKTATVDKGKDVICNDIQDTFERLRTALNTREVELLDMAGYQSQKGDESVEDKIKCLSEQEAEVNKNIASLKSAKLAGKIDDMVKIQKVVREYKSEPLKVAEKEEESQTTSSFNGREESVLINRISNFGDIQTSTLRRGRGYNSSSSNLGYSSSSSLYTGSSYNRYTPKYSTRKY